MVGITFLLLLLAAIVVAGIAITADDATKARLEFLARMDQRSASNYLTLLVNQAWAARNLSIDTPLSVHQPLPIKQAQQTQEPAVPDSQCSLNNQAEEA